MPNKDVETTQTTDMQMMGTLAIIYVFKKCKQAAVGEPTAYDIRIICFYKHLWKFTVAEQKKEMDAVAAEST